jgi:hypothetical protein
MRGWLPLICICAGLGACAAPDSRVQELEQQLRERNAEISALHRQLGTAEKPAPTPAPEAAPAQGGVSEDETRALERALVRQGGSIIPQGAIEAEPEFDYFYSEPNGGRRDTFVSAITLRYGLPWALQADLRVPYVIYDRQTGFRSVSGLGDVELALTKDLVAERELVPELLFTGRWKTTTGRTSTVLPLGTGSDTLQALLTAVKTQDPIVLFGRLSYTESLGHGPADLGNLVGGTIGSFLAATPNTSVFLDVDVNSSLENRIGVIGANRLVGLVETGATTVLSRATVLDINAGIGFTSAAPNFRLIISLPTRF